MSEHEHKHEVKIFIDQHAHHSPNPTTGAALYALGKVEPGLELFREVTGDREDPEVPNGPETVHLKEDEHFHSGKPKDLHDLRERPGEDGHDQDRVPMSRSSCWLFPTRSRVRTSIYTVGYEDGPHKNPSGSLMPGGKVYVKDGMIFDVTPTDKS